MKRLLLLAGLLASAASAQVSTLSNPSTTNTAAVVSAVNGQPITPSSVAASGTVTGSNLSGTHSGASSGTNTGDQTTVSGQAGSVANAVTFDNSGSGAASGTTFNGGAARTVSTNTLGALKASLNLSDVASVNTSALNLQGGYVVCQSAVAVTIPADTTEDTTDTCTIPANAVGANGRIVVDVLFTTTNSANTKTIRVKYGSTNYINQPVTASASEHLGGFFANRNSTSSQVGPVGGNAGNFAVTSLAVATSAVDTTASSSLTVTCQKVTGAETCTREAYQVILYPKA